MMLDVLFINGRFHTATLAARRRTAWGCSGLVVGVDDEISGLRAARVVDLAGARAIPGLNDAHHHLSARGQVLMSCDLSPSAVADLDQFYAAIETYAARQPADAWVVGSGYSDQRLGATPEREAIDKISGGRPVWIYHGSGHGGMLNSEAIRRISGDPDHLPDIDGGVVERRPDGTVTGFVAERAVGLATDLLRPSAVEQVVKAIDLASQVALSEGLTSITEPGLSGDLTGNGPSDFGTYQIALERGLLGVPQPP